MLNATVGNGANAPQRGGPISTIERDTTMNYDLFHPDLLNVHVDYRRAELARARGFRRWHRRSKEGLIAR